MISLREVWTELNAASWGPWSVEVTSTLPVLKMEFPGETEDGSLLVQGHHAAGRLVLHCLGVDAQEAGMVQTGSVCPQEGVWGNRDEGCNWEGCLSDRRGEEHGL